MSYTIDMTWRMSPTVEANSREEAIAKAQELYPDHTPEHIYYPGGNSGVDQCLSCGAPLFDDTDCIQNDGADKFCKGHSPRELDPDYSDEEEQEDEE